MNVYIPSRSRFTRSTTLEAIQGQWPGRVFLVCPVRQIKQYGTLADRHGVILLPCEKDGIALTRRFCGIHAQRTGEKRMLMLDDDLRFFHRPSDDVRLYKFDDSAARLPNGMNKMLCHVDTILRQYVHAAISAREGNNRLRYPLHECNRPLRALAFQVEPFLACKHGRVAIMEDFDVALQLLRAGHKNAIITRFSQDQLQTQAAGGCSDYRTQQLQAENVVKMSKLHAGFIKLRQKENKGGGDFGTRQEATIYWQRAWESAQKEWL